MKRFFTVILIIIPFFLQSQTTYPLVKDGGIWREGVVYNITMPDGPHYNRMQFVMQGDTMLLGRTYTKVYLTNYDSLNIDSMKYAGGMREDSQGRVYFVRDTSFYEEFYIFPQAYTDQAEMMLYDFSADVGDTVKIANDEDSTKVVASIDSVNVNGEMRKRINFQDPVQNEPWIEGIGSMNGLFNPALYELEWDYSLNCYEDANIFWTNPDLTVSCFQVSMEENSQLEFRMYPNPASDVVQIETEKGKIKQLTLYDINGRVILRRNVDNDRISLNTSDFDSGLYLIRLNGENGTGTRKLQVVNHK